MAACVSVVTGAATVAMNGALNLGTVVVYNIGAATGAVLTRIKDYSSSASSQQYTAVSDEATGVPTSANPAAVPADTATDTATNVSSAMVLEHKTADDYDDGAGYSMLLVEMPPGVVAMA